MTNTLVFNFYATRDNLHSQINKMHFICLRMYKHIFDNIIICISLDDIYDTFLIKKIQNKFINTFYREGDVNPDISFKIRQNKSEYCESLFFYEEIVNKLNEHDLVFFAHNKGVTRKYNSKELYNFYYWIISMYYHNLKNINKVTDRLCYKHFVSYGTFLVKETNIDKSFMYYCGSFQWLNCKKIYNIIKRKGLDVPKLDGRFYDVTFIGSILTDRMTEVNNVYLDYKEEMDMLCECYEYCNVLGYLTEGFNEDYGKIMKKMSEI